MHQARTPGIGQQASPITIASCHELGPAAGLWAKEDIYTRQRRNHAEGYPAKNYMDGYSMEAYGRASAAGRDPLRGSGLERVHVRQR